ncbi:hypothetical protein Tco_0948025, partial [Tanacetum coccineum]
GKDEGGEEVNPTESRRVIGYLRYLTHTRPDLSFVVGIASLFMEKPKTLHFKGVKHILRYVKGAVNNGLNYVKGHEVEHLFCFMDSDHVGDVVGAKRIGGMIFYLGRDAITWESQKQQIVSLSSCEFEFIAATSVTYQAIRLNNLVKELTGKIIVEYVKSKDKQADIFTKALRQVMFTEI